MLKPKGYENKHKIIDTLSKQTHLEEVFEIVFSNQLMDLIYGRNLSWAPVFDAMKKYMIGKKTLFGITQEENAHEILHRISWLKTNPQDCVPWTIRSLYGKIINVNGIDIIDNAIHRSKTLEQALRDAKWLWSIEKQYTQIIDRIIGKYE